MTKYEKLAKQESEDFYIEFIERSEKRREVYETERADEVAYKDVLKRMTGRTE